MTIDEIVRACKKTGQSYGQYVATHCPAKPIVKHQPKSACGTVAFKYVCPVCKTEFYSFKRTAIYCSETCKSRGYYLKKLESMRVAENENRNV